MDLDSVRNGYEELGVDNYYKKNSLTYTNPHELKIYNLLNDFLDHNIEMNKESKILDLCCGSGEITRFLLDKGYENIIGLDPYTNELYKEKTNKNCIDLNFKDISNGKLNESFDIIFCSFALHLAEESMLPNILYNLSLITENLVILTPHKKPDIKLYFNLVDELYQDKVRLRYYQKDK